MTTTTMSRRRRTLVAATLTAALVLSTPAASWAYWSATATPVTATAKAATVPVPANFACVTAGTLTQTANFSWTALPALDSGQSWRYQVWVRAQGQPATLVTTAAGQTGTSIVISQGLLTGLVGGLIDLLFGGTPTYIYTVAVHPSGWTSTPTTEIRIAGGGLAGLTGVKCA